MRGRAILQTAAPLVFTATLAQGETDSEPPVPPDALPLRCHPRLAPYIGALNLLPVEAGTEGALIASDPVTDANAAVKRALAEHGFTYSLFQSFGMAATPSRVRDPAVGGVWAGQGFGFLEIFDESRSGGSAGWVSTEINWVVGLGGSVEHEDPALRIGTALHPQGLISGEDFWIAELAWQQSFFDGTLIATVGMIDQLNYFDVNTFANNQFTQLMNNAFVNSQTIAAPPQGIGVNVAWQPSEWFYAIYGSFTTASSPGSAPFSNISASNWGNQLELGVITNDFLGLGRNVFRVQPFIATVNDVTSGGISLNIEQFLGGEGSRIGWFGRFGVCNPDVAIAGFASQISTGLALEAPADSTNLRVGEADRWAFGFVWGRPAQDGAYLPDEYGVEMLYSLQLTPTLAIRPDLQLLWTSGDTGTASPSAVIQLQATWVW